MKTSLLPCLLVALLVGTSVVGGSAAKAADQEAEKPAAEQQADNGTAELYKRFEETMSGVKLVGRFTILGRDEGPLSKEEYTIHSVKKLPDGDQWLFNARINYGKYDLTLPLTLDVKWAGDTPIVTLTDLTIPVLGTFSARVVFYNNKYAGTWTHGKVGGHLFGVIEKLEPEEDTGDGTEP